MPINGLRAEDRAHFPKKPRSILIISRDTKLRVRGQNKPNAGGICGVRVNHNRAKHKPVLEPLPLPLPQRRFLQEASKVARTGGARAVKEFIRTKGYNVNNDWCGDFTNAIVASTGAKTPTNPSLASNWLQWGQEVSPENVQAGDVAVKTQSRFGGPTTPGQRGGHVGVIGPGGFDPKTGQVYIQQGNVSGGKYREGWDKPGEWTFRRAIPTDAMLAAQVATQQPAAQQQVPQQPVAQQDPSKLYGQGS
jgi:hypothetical protein